MSKKEQMIIEVARLYKGITVSEFCRRFGKYDKETLARAVRLAKAIYIQEGVLV